MLIAAIVTSNFMNVFVLSLNVRLGKEKEEHWNVSYFKQTHSTNSMLYPFLISWA